MAKDPLKEDIAERVNVSCLTPSPVIPVLLFHPDNLSPIVRSDHYLYSISVP